MENECGNMLRSALIIVNKEIRDISTTDLRRRIQDFRQLEEFSSRYEARCGQHLSQQVRNNDIASFKLAELKLAYTMHEEELSDGDSQLAGPITKKFTDDEYDAFRLYEKFGRIDMLRDNEIASALVNRDEQIYRIIKEWYEEQMDTFLNLLDPMDTTHTISGLISVAMRDRYNSRFQKIRDGIIAYIKQDPGQLRKLFSNYEGMIDSIVNSENLRIQTENDMRNLLSGDEIESVFDDFQTLTTYVQRRELDKLASMDIDGLSNRVKNLTNIIETKRGELERERDRLDNDPEMRLNSTLRANERGRIEESISKATSYIDRLQREIMEGIVDLKDISVQMENIKAEGGIPDEKGVTHDEAYMLKEQFFQDVRRVLEERAPFKLKDPIAHYELKVKEGGDFIVDNWSMEHFNLQSGENEPMVSASIMSYEFWKHRIISTDSNIALKAAVLLHEKVNKDNKIDMYQIGIADFAPLYARLISDSQSEAAFNYVVVGSPNGFTESLIKQVSGETKGSPLRGRRLCLVLRDLKTGRTYFDGSNPEAKEFVSLLVEVEEEKGKTKLLKARTLEECKKVGVVRLAFMLKETSATEDEMLEAWKELEKDRKGKITRLEGETVFETK